MLLICLLVLFIASPLFWLIRPHRLAYAGWIATLPPGAVTIWLLTQMGTVQSGTFPTEVYQWVPQLGLELSLRLDGLSLFFGLIIVGIGTGIAFYTAYYLEGDPRLGYFYCLLYAFMGSMLGLVWADNLLLLFVFWEGTSITSYLMVGYKHGDSRATAGARQALVVTGFGGLAMLGGFILLGQEAGTYSLSQILLTDGLTGSARYTSFFVLIAIGAFTKSAQFPFQFWLPGAMAAPTPASAYLHSATMVKAGIYLLARLHPALSDSPIWFWTLLIVGGATMLLGAVSALRYYDLKRILAYATVSQLGILVMLLAFDTEYAMIAVVVGILGHALYKGPLFMIAGIVDHATGTRDIRRLAGLWRPMPWVAAAAVLAGLSMAGIPPLLGFLSKETLLEALFHFGEEMAAHDGSMIGWVFASAGALTGAIFVGYSLTLVIETFLRAKASSDDPAYVHHAPSFGFVAAPLFLAALGLLLPLFIGFVEGPLLDPPASAIAGETVHMHLALFHGFTAVFNTSLAAITLGVVIFLLRNVIRSLFAKIPESFSGVSVFNYLYDSSYVLASSVTRFVQGGSLASQSSIILLAGVAGLLYALTKLDWVADLRIPWDGRPEFQEVVITVLAIVAALLTVRAQTRLNAIISMGVVGVTMTLFFIFFGAPDLALTQLLIEVLTSVLLVLVFYKIPADALPPHPKAILLRNVLVACAVGFFGFALVLINAGPPFDPSISSFFTQNSVPAAHGGNIVNVILVDFRGFDTMGEITVLAIAAIGGYALLRSVRLREVSEMDQHTVHGTESEKVDA